MNPQHPPESVVPRQSDERVEKGTWAPFKSLLAYLHYQHPSTKGDLRLKENLESVVESQAESPNDVASRCAKCGEKLTGHEDENGTNCRWCVVGWIPEKEMQADESRPVAVTPSSTPPPSTPPNPSAH